MYASWLRKTNFSQLEVARARSLDRIEAIARGRLGHGALRTRGTWWSSPETCGASETVVARQRRPGRRDRRDGWLAAFLEWADGRWPGRTAEAGRTVTPPARWPEGAAVVVAPHRPMATPDPDGMKGGRVTAAPPLTSGAVRWGSCSLRGRSPFSLGVRLAYLQLARHPHYTYLALDQRLRGIPVDPRRGRILDRQTRCWRTASPATRCTLGRRK